MIGANKELYFGKYPATGKMVFVYPAVTQMQMLSVGRTETPRSNPFSLCLPYSTDYVLVYTLNPTASWLFFDKSNNPSLQVKATS